MKPSSPNATADQIKGLASLAGKVAIVTGATSGIGQGCCVALARAGAFVYVTGREVDKERPGVYGGTKGAAETLQMMQGSSGKGEFAPLDVTSEDDWKRTVDLVDKRFGKLDILVNNAGRGVRKPLEELTIDDLWFEVKLNIDGAFMGMTHFWPLLKKARGVVMNMNSTGGQGGGQNSVIYGGSKGGLLGLTKAAAIDGQPFGIRVISIHPGQTWTPGMKAISNDISEEQYLENIRHDRNTPLGYPAYPLDIGAAIVYLASDAARHITGIEFNIDGGSRAR